jgi:hypothetical protein
MLSPLQWAVLSKGISRTGYFYTLPLNSFMYDPGAIIQYQEVTCMAQIMPAERVVEKLILRTSLETLCCRWEPVGIGST